MKLHLPTACFWITISIYGFGMSELRAEFSDDSIAFFESKIRPVLVEKCYRCHSADAKKLKAGLLLDRRSGHIKGGDIGAAIDIENPNDSLLLETLRYQTPDLEMPPKGKLDDAIIADFQKWIELGAPWPEEEAKDASAVTENFDLESRKNSHWCWQPISDPVAPEISLKNWPLQELDRFVLARLEQEDLKPANETEPLTWLRRVSFDLTGLPPTLAEIKAFQKNPDYEKTVDRLLASPHFGERWARHWMDLARYAETCGHEFDYPIANAYRYRDWLIDAFNQDVAYDQFVTEQIAGDLIQNPRINPTDKTNASIAGTGFWYLHEAVHAPTDIRGDEADRIDNQIDVFGKAFLGLTIACARCHDHKFDAIGTADYYSIAGYLQSSRRQTALLDPDKKITASLAKGKTIRASGEDTSRTSGLFAADAKPTAYLAAAEEAKELITQLGAAKSIVFEDFENGTRDWQNEGVAFADGPVAGTRGSQQKVSGFAGKKTINSYHKGDRSTGTLTSPEFEIEKTTIQFLIGGGGHKGKTCANLIIDGKTVRSTPGKNNERLTPEKWDVAEFIGKKAQIQLVDQATGGWGHLNFDHIVFSDEQDTTAPVIEKIAKKHALSSEHLSNWLTILSKPNWNQLPSPEFTSESSKTLASFDGGNSEGWTHTGFAFPDQPTAAPTWTTGSLGTAITPAGVFSSGLVSKKFQGTLRSPTFELDHSQIHLRVNSVNATIRLVIDEHYMNNFHTLLLKGTILKKEQTDTRGEYKWLTMKGNLDKYIGHRVYLEITDPAHGYIAIDKVLLSNGSFKASPHEPVKPEDYDTFAKHPYENERAAQWSNLLWSNNLLPRNPALIANRDQIEALPVSASIPVVAMSDGTPENERIHIRGSHEALGEIVPRRDLAALGGKTAPNDRSGRLELAKELTSNDNPLVRRVIVNRLWHHLFGRGIVPTVDDFGAMGQPPSHPDLLDHLATEFSDTHNWSIKSMLKTLVLSRTYRMSSTSNPANDPAKLATLDPDNILLSRAPIRRLQAESIRDSILAFSHSLDPTIGGKSVPINLTNFMEGRGRPKNGGPLDGEGRRSLYLETRRNFLSPLMLAFDQPSPFNAIGRRTVSNVPAQALALMNDPFVDEQMTKKGKETAHLEATVSQKIDHLFLEAFARPATDKERTLALAFLEGNAPSPSAWADLAHALVNKKEFIFLN